LSAVEYTTCSLRKKSGRANVARRFKSIDDGALRQGCDARSI
jgi:hypothetical protein